jgi:hypothetical protein
MLSPDLTVDEFLNPDGTRLHRDRFAEGDGTGAGG